ncbi:MAG: 2-oxoacid:acceptor oxidoreductase subunit alpha [Candidatus Verstraetearchaeota archaeon]|nr:2-oxoacid:acceptor oxidoreductase subunit alpha [Candidatus Verstraetearchaeota archaeon]
MGLNFIIGGAQGGGIETAGLLAVKALAMHGLEVFADREYHSNIKGKHSYSHIRASEERIRSIKYPVDLIGALDVETIATHYKDLKPGGVLIHDAALLDKPITKLPPMEKERLERLKAELEKEDIGNTVREFDKWLERNGRIVLPFPFSVIITEKAKLASPMIERAMNTAMTTLLLRAAGMPFATILEAVDALFMEKVEAKELNKAVANAVNDGFNEFSGNRNLGTEIIGKKRSARGKKMLVAGNDAVAIGKLIGGLRLQTYYPITPAADESFVIEQHSSLFDLKGEIVGSPIVIQAEDEISAICMAIGGALTGVRAATCTSGPGFSLMVEGIGWAGMNEVPVVITYYQRGGPSTGLPTRHSQSDLLFAINSGHGEFSRIVLASGSHEEAIDDAIKCMNLAERYQVPVIHLLDKGIANCVTTINPPVFGKIERGKLTEKGAWDYRRFAFDGDPVSPRAFLGDELMWYTGDEHDELGHISEDPENRRKMYEKRMAKREKILKEAPDEDKAVLFGDENFEDLLVTWGVTTGAAVDSLPELQTAGSKTAILQVRMMEPFPVDFVSKFISKANRVISLEANYIGQLAELIGWNTGFRIKNRILKYTGRLITQDEVVKSYMRILGGEEKIVLMGGE